MIVVHHLENSRSQRILWLLEELGLDYEVKRYQRHPTTLLAPETLRAIHPLGKSPIVTDGDLTLVESGAVIEYLVDRYGAGKLGPPPGATPERFRYIYWLHYAEGSAMPPLLLKLIFNRVKTGPMPFFVRPVARMIANKVSESFVDPQLELHVGYMESELGKSTWFAGAEFSGADIQMSFPVEAAVRRAGDTPRPHLSSFLDRIHGRAAYKRALERGGPFQMLG
jgi:glutathione S-transferase